MKSRLTSLVAIFALLGIAPSSFAGLIVNVENIQLQAGGSGTIDVLISSDSTDDLDGAQYKFEITGGGGSSLLFDSPQNLVEGFDPFNTDPNYVFGNDGFGLTEISNTGTTVTHADGGFFGPVSMTTTERLLVRLDVTHSGPVAAQEVFNVSLVDDFETVFTENAFLFQATSGVLGGLATPVASGTVTVNPASGGVVPEPTSAAIFAIGLLSVCGIRQRRKSSM